MNQDQIRELASRISSFDRAQLRDWQSQSRTMSLACSASGVLSWLLILFLNNILAGLVFGVSIYFLARFGSIFDHIHSLVTDQLASDK